VVARTPEFGTPVPSNFGLRFVVEKVGGSQICIKSIDATERIVSGPCELVLGNFTELVEHVFEDVGDVFVTNSGSVVNPRNLDIPNSTKIKVPQTETK
jgi:hypothetical protein